MMTAMKVNAKNDNDGDDDKDDDNAASLFYEEVYVERICKLKMTYNVFDFGFLALLRSFHLVM